MRYFSTRNPDQLYDFEHVLLGGLAADGGLYLPEKIPSLKATQLQALEKMALAGDYVGVAVEVMLPFVTPCFDRDELTALCRQAYANFNHPDTAPLVKLSNPDIQIMELFHGSTLAFKDFALQFLGLAFDAVLKKKGARMTLIGATSGDTGSAAMAACQGKDTLDLFILFPDGRVSEVQRRQMTTVNDPHIHALAIEGNFDDCQYLVKHLFADKTMRETGLLSAVNSINWARIMAQIVYYIYGGLRGGALQKPASFIVPTGNFGNVFAGYIAMRMGLPVSKLIIATNQNDVLHRFFETGEMRPKHMQPSLSPSMDIQISSNFERLLFYFNKGDGQQIDRWQKSLRVQGSFTVDNRVLAGLQQYFMSVRVDDKQTLKVIADFYKKANYIADPHTAVALAALEEFQGLDNPIILSTAHPAKFPDAIEQAISVRPDLPEFLQDIMQKPENVTRLPADKEKLRDYIRGHLKSQLK